MANTENIEAKLCAYVDGELDAAGRAEIEQHLATNPQHRVLMAELTAQREEIRALPRAKAPDDLLESVQNQLERSVLLDQGEGETPQVAGRIEHWPQILSAAAVLFMVVGLLAVILYVLPPTSRSRRASPVAMKPASAPVLGESVVATTAPTADLTVAMSDKDSKDALRELKSPAVDTVTGGSLRDGVAAGKSGAIDLAPAATAAPPPASPPVTDVFAKGSGGPLMRKGGEQSAGTYVYKNVFANAPNADVEEKLKSNDLPDNSLYMVVSSNNPSAANQQAQDYLKNNGIVWDPVPEPAPQPIAQGQTLSGARMQETRMKLKSAGDLAQVQQQQQPQSERVFDSQKKLEQRPEAGKESADAAALAEKDAQLQKQGQQQAVQAPATAAPAGNAASQTDQFAGKGAGPAQQQQVAQQTLTDASTRQSEQAAAPPELPATTPVEANGVAPARTQFIIARGLTAEQVVNLNGCLEAQNGGRVSNWRRTGTNLAPTTLPTPGALAGAPAIPTPAAAPTVQQPSKATGERGAVNEAAQPNRTAARASAPTTTTTASRTDALAEASPPPAASEPSILSNATKENPVADALDRERHLSRQDGKFGPATLPFVVAGGAGQFVQPATTQPAVQPQQPRSDERLDVVIVVQSDPAATGAGADQIQQRVEPNAATPPPPAAAQQPQTRTAPTSQP